MPARLLLLDFQVALPQVFSSGRMFVFSITYKLLVWYFAFRAGDSGRPSRPWILSVIVAFGFAAFDVCTDSRLPLNNLILFATYLVLSLVLMNIYYRIHSMPLSLLVAGVSLLVLLIGAPFLADMIFFDAFYHAGFKPI